MKIRLSGQAKISGSDKMEVPGLADILAYARRLGWQRAVFRSAYVASNLLIKFSIFECFRLRQDDINCELIENPGDYECRFMRPHELDRFSLQLDSTLAGNLRRAIGRGDVAYVILDGVSLASIGLYAAAPTPILNDLMLHFDLPVRYMYQGFTQEAYRGQRLHALGILRAAQELFELQIPQLVTVCEKTNYPATISVHRMGWKACGTLYRVGLGPWNWLGRTADAESNAMRLEFQPAGHSE